MRPFAPGKSTYCRLLPPIRQPFQRGDMRKLAFSMKSNQTHIPHDLKKPPPKAPYTYFGQFIMHDLTQDDTPLSEEHPPEATEIVNQRTPSLELDSLYGEGPFSKDAPLYDDDRASFKLGSVRTENGAQFDLPLDPVSCGVLIADSRNNENLILRQLHVMFLKLHNAAVVELRGSIPEAMLFEKARERVRQQYQWLIQNDFLPHLCNAAVYDEIVRQRKYAIHWEDGFAIPVEFAHAAGRFGHSMVRDTYTLNPNTPDVPVSKIVHEAHKPGGLDPALSIEWRAFVNHPANFIDTTIVNDLFKLPTAAIQPFVRRVRWIEPRQLPVRTLYRNIRMKLPSGEEVREALDSEAALCSPPCGYPEYQPYKALDELGLRGKTPLWYYILLEAELGNEGFCDVTRGSTLGLVGSRLLAEVLEGALRATPNSILDHPGWRPLAWSGPSGVQEINNLLDLAIVVGLAE